ncbi:MAG: hypothetical protein ACLPPV_13290 [Candidatus Korobacteraceae bacterium]|jgi:hypothetical protein
MERPRFHPIRNTLAAITVAGAMILTVAAPAAATPWQKAWGDYDSHRQWHDASWWLQNRHDWVTSHHPEWTENYAATRGQIGDSDRFHLWHYGDGGSDRATAAAIDAAKNEARKLPATPATKAEASVKSARES